MARYTEERRQAVVAKLLPPQSLTPQEVAEQEGISLPTIYKWLGEGRAAGRCVRNAGVRGAGDWSSEDRFAAVLETASMNAEETAEYCRRRGLYAEHLVSWRRDCEQAGSLSQEQRRRESEELKTQRRRIRELERELRRKDAALAETAALLALRKKAAVIWGDEA